MAESTGTPDGARHSCRLAEMNPTTESLSKLMTRLTVVFALAAIVCGLIGFPRAGLSPGDGLSASTPLGRVFDYMYLSLSMLTLAVRNGFGEPFILAGRWFGVLFVFSAVVRALAPQIVETIVRARVARFRGHTVVIGLGNRGRAYLRDAASSGAAVGLDLLATERADVFTDRERRRVHLLRGDGRLASVLSRLNLARASRVIVCSGADVANDRIARAVLAVLQLRGSMEREPVELLVHFQDPRLGRVLIDALPDTPGARPRPIATSTAAARMLLWDHPWLLGCDSFPGRRAPHWVFIGWDAHAEALLLAAMRLPAPPGQGVERWTVFAPEAERLRASLRRRFPTAGAMLERVRVRNVGDELVPADDEIRSAEQDGKVAAAFVFASADPLAFAAARAIRAAADRAGCWRGPVFVRMDDDRPFADALAPMARVKRLDATIEAFGTTLAVCSLAAIDDSSERLAEAVHRRYLERHGGITSAGTDWSSLDEGYREANRRTLAHMAVKLAALGYIVRGGWPLPAAAIEADPRQRESIARLEHDSWMAEKLLDGWTYAATRDDRRRHHDCLVPFEQLGSEARKDLDSFEFLGRDPSLAAVRAAGSRHAVRGAFRERVIGLAARRWFDPALGAELSSAMADLLVRVGAESRLGRDGDEFWTILASLEPDGEALLVAAMADALEALSKRLDAGRRYRFIIVQAAPFARLYGPQRGAEVARRVCDWPECEAWLVPAVGADRPSPDVWRAATVEAIASRCHEWIALDGPVRADKSAPGPADTDLEGVLGRRDARRRARALEPLDADGLCLVRIGQT